MARVVDDYVFVHRGLSRDHTNYPWNQWFDGRKWMLVSGDDFEISPKDFRTVAHRAAKRLGGRVRSNTVEGGMIIQFVPGKAVV